MSKNQAIVPTEELKKRNNTGFAYTDREIDQVNIARNNRDGYRYAKVDSVLLLENDNDGETETGLLLRQNGDLLKDDNQRTIIELPACAIDQGSPIIPRLQEQLLNLDTYKIFNHGEEENFKKIKILFPYKLSVWHWNVGEIIVEEDGNNLNLTCSTYDSYGQKRPIEDQIYREIEGVFIDKFFNKVIKKTEVEKVKIPTVQTNIACGLYAAIALHNLKTSSNPQNVYKGVFNTTARKSEPQLRNEDSELITNHNPTALETFCRKINEANFVDPKKYTEATERIPSQKNSELDDTSQPLTQNLSDEFLSALYCFSDVVSGVAKNSKQSVKDALSDKNNKSEGEQSIFKAFEQVKKLITTLIEDEEEKNSYIELLKSSFEEIVNQIDQKKAEQEQLKTALEESLKQSSQSPTNPVTTTNQPQNKIEALLYILANSVIEARNAPECKLSSKNCLTEFGQKNLGEFLGYIRDLKIKDDAGNEAFSQKKLEEFATKLALDNKTLASPQFFHTFLLEFHKQRALAESKTNQNPKTFKEGNVLGNHQAFGEDVTGKTNKGGIDFNYSETIGRRWEQEDSFIIGEGKNNWSSAEAPHLMEKVFNELGENIRKYCSQEKLKDGSTALLTHYSTDRKLTIANLGDSRAVLFIKKKDGSIDWIRLTNDQEPDDILEEARIVKNGGRVFKLGTNDVHRVNANLSVARSFGDLGLEGGENDNNGEFNCNGKKLISFKPDIYQYDINKILAEQGEGAEVFLLNSCDGLYDHGRGNETTYAEALKNWFNNKDDVQKNWGHNIAEYLRDYALALGSRDNVTVCFSNITNAPSKSVFNGVFDGHGGKIVSSIAAKVLKEQLLEPDSIIHSPMEKQELAEINLNDRDIIDSTYPYEKEDNLYPKAEPVRVANSLEKRPIPAPPSPVNNSQQLSSYLNQAKKPSAIKYTLDENSRTLTINSIDRFSPNGVALGKEDFLNLFDTEFEPIIEFYKNHGNVVLDNINKKTIEAWGKDRDYILGQLGRIKPDSRLTTDFLPKEKNFENLKNSLEEIEKAKSSDFNNYLKEIAELKTDSRGLITQKSFLKYARKNKDLKNLDTNDVDGNFWYAGTSIDLIRKAYVLDAGFKENQAKSRFEKDGNLVFLQNEIASTGLLDLKELFKQIRKDLRSNKKAQIFLPVNFYNGHWTTLEIEIEKDQNGSFSINCNHYNSMGSGYSQHLDDQIKQQVKETFENAPQNLKIRKTKQQKDGSSCGPISCWCVGERVNGRKAESQDSFESGALDLRLNQIKLIYNQIDAPSAFKTYICYEKPRVLTKRQTSNSNQSVAKSSSTNTKETKITNNISEPQKTCEEILIKLNSVTENEFGFFHSCVRDIFGGELQKIKNHDDNQFAKTNEELFKNAKKQAESFVSSDAQVSKVLTEALNLFQQNKYDEAINFLTEKFKESSKKFEEERQINEKELEAAIAESIEIELQSQIAERQEEEQRQIVLEKAKQKQIAKEKEDKKLEEFQVLLKDAQNIAPSTKSPSYRKSDTIHFDLGDFFREKTAATKTIKFKIDYDAAGKKTAVEEERRNTNESQTTQEYTTKTKALGSERTTTFQSENEGTELDESTKKQKLKEVEVTGPTFKYQEAKPKTVKTPSNSDVEIKICTDSPNKTFPIITPEVLSLNNKTQIVDSAGASHESFKKSYYSKFGGSKFSEKNAGGDKIFGNADLFMSSFRNCVFENVDFSKVKNFDTIGFYGCKFGENCVFPSGFTKEHLENKNLCPTSSPRQPTAALLSATKVEAKGKNR
jgi:serine/threonine protein phosphatase PrpC